MEIKTEKWYHIKKKNVRFVQAKALCQQVIKTMTKLHELCSHYYPSRSYFFMFSNIKSMTAGRKFSDNEKVNIDTEVYFH